MTELFDRKRHDTRYPKRITRTEGNDTACRRGWTIALQMRMSMRLWAGRSIKRMTNYGNQFLYAGSAISGAWRYARGSRAAGRKGKNGILPARGRSVRWRMRGSARSAGAGPDIQDWDIASGLRPALFGHIKETGGERTT